MKHMEYFKKFFLNKHLMLRNILEQIIKILGKFKRKVKASLRHSILRRTHFTSK
jgi:hypothetical protein